MQRGLEDGISRLREGATFLTSKLRLVAPSTLPCRAAGRGCSYRLTAQVQVRAERTAAFHAKERRAACGASSLQSWN